MQPNYKEGVIYANPRGFGFVHAETSEKVFMRPSLLRRFLPKDRIQFTVEPGKNEGELQVAQAWLVARDEGSWLGTIDGTLFEADEPCFVPIQVSQPGTRARGAVVRVSTPALAGPLAFAQLPDRLGGAVVQELGLRSDNGFDQGYALAMHRFEPAFSAGILAHCDQLALADAPSVTPGDGREDLQGLAFVTIDSATTHDFDDAVYAERCESGWRVLVAIADVSHYVRPGSLLDACARERGTSVYLPGQTVPMLPAALSVGLCALRADLPRYAVVVEVLLGEQAQIQGTRVFRAVIRVAENLTYDYVLGVLTAAVPDSSSPVLECLNTLGTLYEKLSLLSEPSLSCGHEAAEPVWQSLADGGSIQWVVRHDAHKLVECFMLLANRQVAKVLAGKSGESLFRHQLPPTDVRWQDLTGWAGSQGHTLPAQPSRGALSGLLGALAPEHQFGAQLQVRAAMATATYDTEKATHFSLGYDTYTHFSSPIRRYADLVVHRLLLGEVLSAQELQSIARHCSDRSRAAKFAERHVWDKLKKRALLANSDSTTQLQAYVVGQSRFGARVVVLPWQCVSEVAASELTGQGLKFNKDAKAWQSTSQGLQLGSYLKLKNFSLDEFRAKTEVRAHLAELSADL